MAIRGSYEGQIEIGGHSDELHERALARPTMQKTDLMVRRFPSED